MAAKMPIISITGPRQSGKTTLTKACFPKHDYVNLEFPDIREIAQDDPRSFLNRFKNGVIIDEAQYVPELFSYIQGFSDESGKAGEYILTGSQNFLLSEKISQSLAGRVFVSHLLPFTFSELQITDQSKQDFDENLFKGFFPRIYDKDIAPAHFYPSYLQTYLERDVRQIVQVSNLTAFRKFMKMAAGRVGQLMNFSNFATELGIDIKTIQSWFSILEASFIVFFLSPYHNNFNKRIVKTPKLYFYDTGLACNLLDIRERSDLFAHWARGALFENMVIADVAKSFYHRGEQPPLYFWRDNKGFEIDLIIEDPKQIKAIEIKSGMTLRSDHFMNLEYFSKMTGEKIPCSLIYGGYEQYTHKGISVLPWHQSMKAT